MGLLIDELGKPRWAGGGLLLLILLSVLLLPPILRNKDINHPLSAEQHLVLCPLLPEPPAALQVASRAAPSAINSAICEFRDSSPSVVLTVGLITTRAASEGAPQRTSAMYETWLKETIASGATDVREQQGDWAMASSYRVGERSEVLIEDHGVMLTLSSSRLDADALMVYARSVVPALRKSNKS